MTSPNGNGSNGYSVPQPRADWLARRKNENKSGNFSQMHYARQGVITEEMSFIAHKEKLTAGTRPRRSGARTNDHSRQHQPS